jgi:serine/threonine-protein kinase
MTDLMARLQNALAGRYTIERELGRGGMATVYLARDVKHERQVALKVLRPELAAALGPERFLQEIRIAANLHHPHILPLYDSDEADGFLYYVMPYVEGESLRERLIREKQLAIDDALRLAREVADALSYAHGQGVIHRDIKPENVLLESGHAVVADFGIARAIDAAGGERLTATGIAVGTPAYMSPEQAAGSKELDGRSDLYALGCVLHEMLAGQPPFTGPTAESLVQQHLTAQPPSVSGIRPSVPGWVVAALERSLAKTPADRFNPVAQFGEAITPRTSVTADVPQRLPAASGQRRWLVPVVVTAGALIVIALVLDRLLAPEPIAITTSNSRAVTRDPGVEFQPAVSPDGSVVAYIEQRGQNTRMVVSSTLDVASGGASRPADDIDGGHWFPAWTPDGASLRFLVCPGVPWFRTLGCTTKEVGTLGGSVRAVDVPRGGIRYAWSHDGGRVAFASRDSIFAYDVDKGDPELLGVVPALPGYGGPHSLAWSPDGQLIALVNGNAAWMTRANVLGASIWILGAGGGEPARVTDDSTMNVSPQWLPDSRHLLFVSDRDGQREVYVVEVGRKGPRGEPQKVAGPTDPHSISLSVDGRRLAYAKFAAAHTIVAVPIQSSGPVSMDDAVPVTEGNQVIEGLSLSPDGEWITFSSDLRGGQGIYRLRLPGGSPELVTDLEGDEFEPDWSGEGGEIAFYSSLENGITVVSLQSGRTEQVTDFHHPGRPAWSPDGLALAFHGRPRDQGEFCVWIVSRDSVGGPWSDAVRLTDYRSGNPDWAPDGASLIITSRGAWLRVSRGGEVLGRYEPAELGLQGVGVAKFSHDGTAFYTVGAGQKGDRGVWRVPVDGGRATRVVVLDDPSPPVAGAFFAVGQERVYLTIPRLESDIWVMDLEW